MPYHLEARMQYFLHDRGVRPYVLLGGGLAEYDPHIVISRLQHADGQSGEIGDVDAYRLVGQGFLTAGGGVWFGIGEHAVINVALKALLPLPTFTFGFAPELGLKFGF